MAGMKNCRLDMTGKRNCRLDMTGLERGTVN